MSNAVTSSGSEYPDYDSEGKLVTHKQASQDQYAPTDDQKRRSAFHDGVRKNSEELREKIHEILRPTAEVGNDDVGDYLEEACDDLVALITERDKKHIKIYRWLLGCGDGFPISEPGNRYNWRRELRVRLPQYILDEVSRSKEVI